MTRTLLSRTSRISQTLGSASLLTLASALLLTGCGAGTPAAAGPDSLLSASTLSGKMYGGNSPVIGATVQLYSVGTSGYGSAGTLLATATTIAPNGGFTFNQQSGVPFAPSTSTYACPTSTTQIYLLATSGNTGSGTNANSAAIAAIGPCSGASGLYIDMNEVTSTATMAAMQQYFNPTADSIGSPSGTGHAQAVLGLANAQAIIPNLVALNTGTANATFAPASSVTGVTMFATPESAKINLIADIIAACINTTGVSGSTSNPNGCDTLFSNVTPPPPAYTSQPGATFPATPTDTVQALYYMFTNPTQTTITGSSPVVGTQNQTNNVNLFKLVNGQSPFPTTITAAPLDWTIGINYFPGANATTTTSTKCSATTKTVFFSPTMKTLAVDAGGNVWFNGGSSGTGNAFGEISPIGSPLNCPNTVVTGTGLTLGFGLAIDPNGNVYTATATQIAEVAASNGAVSFRPTTNLAGMAVDKNGNLFYVPSTATPVQEFAATSGNAGTSAVSVGSNLTAGTFLYVATDQNGDLFAVPNASSNLLDLFPDTGTHATNGYYSANIGSTGFQSTSYGVSVDSAGSLFGGNTCCAATLNNTLWKLKITQPAAATDTTAPTLSVTQSAKYIGGVVAPRGQAIDGAGNLWVNMADPVLNALQSSSGADVYAISEISNDLAVGLSPNGVTPSTCISSDSTITPAGPNCQTNGGFQKAAYSASLSLAIDPSGNVWSIAQTSPGSIVEMVGQAVPAVTPIVSGQGIMP